MQDVYCCHVPGGRAALLVVFVAMGVSGGVIVDQSRGAAPAMIAVVNSDTGRLGAKIIENLQLKSGYWVDTTSSDVATGAFAATITLPANLTASLESIATRDSGPVQLSIDVDERADARLVAEATNTLEDQVRVAGIRESLATVRVARDLIGQASLTTRVLLAGIEDAVDTSRQFKGDASRMLASLHSVQSRATEVGEQVSRLDNSAEQLGSSMQRLITVLDDTGLTVGQVLDGAAKVSSGLGEVLPILRSSPFAADPAVSAAIDKLSGLREIASQTSDQLDGAAQISGTVLTPDTPVSVLMRDGMKSLSSARRELNDSANFAKQVPGMVDAGTTRLMDAQRQFDSGLGKMHTVLGNLDELTRRALAALPQQGDELNRFAAFIDAPVELVDR